MTDHPSGLPRAIFLHAGAGSLTVARALRRHGVEVHALTDERDRNVLAGRGVRGRTMPHIGADRDTWLAELDRFAATGGGVVVPGSDEACAFLVRYRAELAPSLRTFEAAGSAHLVLMDPIQRHRTATEAGVRVPWMRHVRTFAELAAVRGELTYPCVVTPALGVLGGDLPGSGRVCLRSEADLMERAAHWWSWASDVLITEHVPGPLTAVETAVSIRARDGSYPLEYGQRTLRQWPPVDGVASLVESTDAPDALKLNRILLDHAGFHGVSSSETKRHAETGELYLTKVDVRMPATFGLAQASGADGAWRLYAALAGLPLGRPASPAQPVHGRKTVLHTDLPAAVHRIRSGDASVTDVLRTWRGTRDVGVLDPRDPMPALVLAGGVLRTRLRRRRRPPRP